MKSTLIKDTTKSERIQLVKQWEETEGCESSGIDLLEFFREIGRAHVRTPVTIRDLLE